MRCAGAAVVFISEWTRRSLLPVDTIPQRWNVFSLMHIVTSIPMISSEIEN